MSVCVFIRNDVPSIWNDNSWCNLLAVYSVSVCRYAIVRHLCVTLQAALFHAKRFNGRNFIFYTSSAHFISKPDSAGTKVYIRELQRTWKVTSSRSAAKMFHVLYGIQMSLLGAGQCLVPAEHYWALGNALFQLNIIHFLTSPFLRFSFMLFCRTFLGLPIYLLFSGFSPKGHESFSSS
jgi:hypothetical protein